jgi:hypothetical protein
MLLVSCSRDPVEEKKENDFLDKIDQLVAELGPTLPHSWNKPTTCSDKYMSWERCNNCQYATRTTGYLRDELKSADPIWEAKSLIIFDNGFEFIDQSSNNYLNWVGEMTPHAWIVDINTKAITGYFQGQTHRLTIKKPDSTPIWVTEDGNEYQPVLDVEKWLSSVTKTNQASPNQSLAKNPEIQDNTTIESGPKSISLGKFRIKVPTEWLNFNSSEVASLRRQYIEQSNQISQQYSGSDFPAKSVQVAAFHILNNAGTFIIVSAKAPEHLDLITLLKNQIGEKMDWGVRSSYLRKYLGFVSIDDEKFSSFYTKAIGKDGAIEISGALEYKKLKNTVIQLTLLCPQDWDQAKASNTFTAVIKSSTLTTK